MPNQHDLSAIAKILRSIADELEATPISMAAFATVEDAIKGGVPPEVFDGIGAPQPDEKTGVPPGVPMPGQAW